MVTVVTHYLAAVPAGCRVNMEESWFREQEECQWC